MEDDTTITKDDAMTDDSVHVKNDSDDQNQQRVCLLQYFFANFYNLKISSPQIMALRLTQTFSAFVVTS